MAHNAYWKAAQCPEALQHFSTCLLQMPRPSPVIHARPGYMASSAPCIASALSGLMIGLEICGGVYDAALRHLQDVKAQA